MGLFDPNPDYPFLGGGKELSIDAGQMGPYVNLFQGGLGLLQISSWPISPGQMVTAGDAAAVVVTEQGTDVGRIRVPRAGMITAVSSGAVPQGRMFSLRYFEDGAEMIDPFADLAKWRENLKAVFKKQREDVIKSAGRIAIAVVVAMFVMVVIGASASGAGAAALIAFAFLGILLAVEIPKMKQLNKLDFTMKQYFPD